MPTISELSILVLLLPSDIHILSYVLSNDNIKKNKYETVAVATANTSNSNDGHNVI